MENQLHEIYAELRKMKAELEEKCSGKEVNDLIKEFIQEEIHDIEHALKKMETGDFGICEISGEIIPFHYLTLIPTLKSAKDLKSIERYYKKPIYSSSIGE
ncbi:hypothetical protein PB1_01460 [Bacillus methanolicus PB1]|uniref:DksA C4-type domain-containing protein n=1 Tax=Bacillus methanolicus PB1 TaxID=997296 RepID=I3E500_BACMT|nr:hypothetical protein [Bacillus methanolicus]EIJ81571.1 hypothetical protein PB1_01460 [Bacillus methanolicus PB1]